MKKFFLLTIGLFMTLNSHSIDAKNLSHKIRESTFESAKQSIIEKIIARGDLPYATINTQLQILNDCSEFGLGRFLIERGGLNGYWTNYIVQFPSKNDVTFTNQTEKFLLTQSPTCLATQERFRIFKRIVQDEISDNISLASLPCGLMADLLDLDYSNVSSYILTGLDLDRETLGQAAEYAKQKGLESHCKFEQIDAWKIIKSAEYDILVSNGLAIYEPDDEKVIDLYRKFYDALKPGGKLITSFLSPPPVPAKETEWNLSSVDMQHALLQKILFVDILDAKWQTFRSQEKVTDQLRQAGFKNIQIQFDSARIFPTIMGAKPNSSK